MKDLYDATLSNGLRVLIWETHAAPVATFWVWYRVGSRNEMTGSTGISHWVEHMLFKGTPSRPGGTLTRLVDRLGGRWNAFTWKDYTAYFEVLPAEHLETAVRLEQQARAVELGIGRAHLGERACGKRHLGKLGEGEEGSTVAVLNVVIVDRKSTRLNSSHRL